MIRIDVEILASIRVDLSLWISSRIFSARMSATQTKIGLIIPLMN